MENYKEKIEKLRSQIKILENLINKPIIGKWYKGEGLWFPLEIIGDKEKSFGFYDSCADFEKRNWRQISENAVEADYIEIMEALTKYADTIYKDVNKVDRTGLECEMIIDTVSGFYKTATSFDRHGFCYNGIYVMDNKGNWATPVINYDVEIINNTLTYNATSKVYENGKYKLVKI